jgi:hypothetical protein
LATPLRKGLATPLRKSLGTSGVVNNV